MSPDATPPANAQPTAPPAPSWVPIPATERRILGVLIEKQKTAKSSESYPLTLNSLVTGCNQKTNRDPVLELNEFDVEDGLTWLQKNGFVARLQGGRVEKFRHLLYDLWTKNGPEMAVLAELLLRGPQTKGDLRGRAARMDPIDTLEALDEILKTLTTRRLAIYLTEADRRGAVVSHGFHTSEELAQLRKHFASAPASAALPEPVAVPARPTAVPVPVAAAVVSVASVTPVASTVGVSEANLAAAVAEIGDLKDRVTFLETTVADLRKELGLPPSAG